MNNIYKLDTIFDFGKMKGKSLRQVIEAGERAYIGWLLFHKVERFIIHIDTINSLNEHRYFKNLPISHYPLGQINILNEWWQEDNLVEHLKERYFNHINQ